MEYCSENPDTYQGLPEQYSILGQGAQYVVGMLTGPEESYEEFNTQESGVPRVLKIPLPRKYVELAVANMNIAPQEHGAKVDTLISERKKHAVETILRSYCDEELYTMIGRPHTVAMYDAVFTATQHDVFFLEDEGVECGTLATVPVYTQDFSPSVSSLIRTERTGGDHARLRELIENYASVQQELIRRGLFDDIFKLDNYGYNDSGLTVHDFSELATDKTNLEEAIEYKKWERITENTEFTQLSPNMQDYFNDRMSALLQKSIFAQWGTYVQPASRTFPPPVPDIVYRSTVKRIAGALLESAT